jgi:hypothetical protein
MTSTGCDLTQEDLLGKTLKQLLSEQAAVTSSGGCKRNSLFDYDVSKCIKCKQSVSRHGCNKSIQQIIKGHPLMEMEYKSESGDIFFWGHHRCECGVQAIKHVRLNDNTPRMSNII